ncbi:UbiE/COQ5 methyltransferase family protein [Hyphomicrobiales bacterium]|nr:UbiE/COQ5 methyltransferase family protein [Hyphomicrobiales bacterium]CAH1666561.1 UbiE/COQ5 methyltransferase family protein [Hyphomicrobiales bacterium]
MQQDDRSDRLAQHRLGETADMSETTTVLAFGRNHSIKDEIRAYWSKRSETFDLSVAHKIRSSGELEAWRSLVQAHAPDIAGGRVLELASGTGEFTRVLLALGCRVDGIDLSEDMVARAQAKHRGQPARFLLGDAENTMMPDDSYDAVVSRHLVWTLVDPDAAFRDWLRCLKPGGTLIIADGDWVTRSWRSKVLGSFGALWDRLSPKPKLFDADAHASIAAQLFFSEGLRAGRLKEMLAAAGFTAIRAGGLGAVPRSQLRDATWRERLGLFANYDNGFVVSARKPSARGLADSVR